MSKLPELVFRGLSDEESDEDKEGIEPEEEDLNEGFGDEEDYDDEGIDE